jgi:hypothetical protein
VYATKKDECPGYGPKIKIKGTIQKDSRGFFWGIVVNFLTIKEKTKINSAQHGLYFKNERGAHENMFDVAHEIALELQVKLRGQGSVCDILDRGLVN